MNIKKALNTCREILQAAMLFFLGFGTCYYINITRTLNETKGITEECIPLYNYCVYVEKENKELKNRDCNE